MLDQSACARAEAWQRYSKSEEGRRRSGILWHYLAMHLPGYAPLSCLDAGCGAGEIGLRLLAQGHTCTFLDASLPLLQQVEETAGAIFAQGAATFRCGDLPAIIASLDERQFDVIVLHSVLEFLPDPAHTFSHLPRLLRPGGVLSLAVANTWGQVLKIAIEGTDPSGACEALSHPPALRAKECALVGRSYTPQEAEALVCAAGFHPIARYGVRVAADYARQDARSDDSAMQAAWLQLEIELGQRAPFCEIGRLTQIIAQM